MTPVVAAWQVEGVWRRLGDYLALTKPRVVAMVLVTTAVGFRLGSAGSPLVLPLLYTLAGTALAAAGTLALNQYMERDLDARMERTRRRPLPEGRVHPGEALVLGCALLVAGVTLLALTVEPIAAVVTAAIAITYLLGYTPLKRVSPLCSLVGAIPGALPPVAGWAAARGTLGLEPWILFAIMFLWQIPHTLAIGRLYRDDYTRAGIRVLPAVARDGRATGLQAVCNCLALLPVALLPTVVGLAGIAYFLVALVLGLAFLWSAVGLARGGSSADARRLLFASLVYLPVVLAVMALDKVGPASVVPFARHAADTPTLDTPDPDSHDPESAELARHALAYRSRIGRTLSVVRGRSSMMQPRRAEHVASRRARPV